MSTYSVGFSQSDPTSMRKVDNKEYTLGVNQATMDLKGGLITYKIIGQPRMIDSKLKRLAKEKYGVTVVFHGCCAGPRIDYDEGYLATVRAYLTKKYKADPIPELEKELGNH